MWAQAPLRFIYKIVEDLSLYTCFSKEVPICAYCILVFRRNAARQLLELQLLEQSFKAIHWLYMYTGFFSKSL